MVNLNNRYAAALLEYAQERGRLKEFYREALLLAHGISSPNDASLPQDLTDFLKNVPPKEVRAVMRIFMVTARDRLGLLDVEISSAVPLTERQLAELEVKLIRIFHKQLEITTKVDPKLLGGLRIIAGNTVIDDTIKRKLMDMRRSVYKGVYFGQ